MTSVTLFLHYLNQKLLLCIHLSLFMHTLQNNTILSSFNITYSKSGIILVKVKSAWWDTRELNLNEFQNCNKLYQVTAE